MSLTKMKKSAWILKCSPDGNYNNLKIFDLNYGVVHFFNSHLIILLLFWI